MRGVDLTTVIDIQLQIIIDIIYFQYLFYNNQNGIYFLADKQTNTHIKLIYGVIHDA